MKEAAERLRRLVNGEPHKSVYGREGPGAAMDRERDEYEVATAYLREHDETPVTGDWLLSVGFERRGGVYPIYVSPKSIKAGPVFYFRWEPDMGCDGWSITGGGALANMETRGEVRIFCSAMGIPLKEQEQS